MDIKTLRDLLRLESRLRDELVVKRLREGETMQAVADDLGVTRQWVQQMAKRAGYHARAEKQAAKLAQVTANE